MIERGLASQGLLGTGPFLVLCAAVVVGLVVRLGSRRLRASRDRRHAVARTALDGALVLAVALVVAATLVPQHLGGTAARHTPTAVNLDPFHTIGNILRWGSPAQQYDNLVLNVLLFVPFGWAMALKARRHLPALVAFLAGTALSVAVEAGQYVLPLGRSTDVDDVLLNGVGALLGALAAIAVLPALRWVAHSRRGSTTAPA